MNRRILKSMTGYPLAVGAVMAVACWASAAELQVEDFKFDGPLGSQGATVEKLTTNHFKVTLGHAPEHPDWANHLQFQILRNAKGNALRVTAEFRGETQYAFTGNFSSWSYDGKAWQSIAWSSQKTEKTGETRTRTAELNFPVFEQDTVWFGFQVPMTYEDSVALIEKWKQHPAVKVHVVGQSLGKRNIYRLEITDPDSPHPRERRWVHYFANQHPGEFNAMWRMVGMIDWLLSDEGADARKRSICHFTLMQSPDGPSCGWHRTNAQGLDMNRTYARGGANEAQGHEPYLCQKDLEAIMASTCPATTIWSMHTWPGPADPTIVASPQLVELLGPPTRFAEILQRYDPEHKLVKKLTVDERNHRWPSKKWAPPEPGKEPEAGGGGSWSSGPRSQFGVTALLCEGGGDLKTRKENTDSGVVLIKGLTEYCKGIKPAP